MTGLVAGPFRFTGPRTGKVGFHTGSAKAGTACPRPARRRWSYGCTGVTSRVEAAAVAHRGGLVDQS
jgi:hypothetical protein